MGWLLKREIVILISAIILVSLFSNVASAVVRHDRYLKPVETQSVALEIVDRLLSSDEVLSNSQLSTTLRDLRNALLSGDVELASQSIGDLKKFLENSSMKNVGSDERSLLAYLASLEVSEGDGNALTVTLNPDELERFIKVLSGESYPISNLEAASSLLKLATALNRVDPSLSGKLRDIAALLALDKYREASQLYGELRPQLLEKLMEAYSSGLLSEEDVAEIFRYLPTEITSKGPVKLDSDALSIALENLLNLEFKSEPMENPDLNPVKALNQLNSMVREVPQIGVLQLYPSMISQAAIYLLPLLLVTAALTTGVFLIFKKNLIIKAKIRYFADKLSKKTRNLTFKHEGDIREMISEYYDSMVKLLNRVGIRKMIYETHRELMGKVLGSPYSKYVGKICMIYEKAVFSRSKPSLEDLRECEKNFIKLSGEVIHAKP